jgi:hypothetical protein
VRGHSRQDQRERQPGNSKTLHGNSPHLQPGLVAARP